MSLPDGGSVFWLTDAIVAPEQSYNISVSVRNASIPVTHYVITDENNTLSIIYNQVTNRLIILPKGNRSIDELVIYLKTQLEFGFSISYKEATNTLILNSPTDNLAIGSTTTCSVLLGLKPGMSSSNGVLESHGIDLRGTSAYYIESNLRTRNRNPVDRGAGSLLATIPITRAHNGVEIFRDDVKFDINDRIVNYILIRIVDDDMKPVIFNGGSWSIILEFDITESRVFRLQRNFREMLSNGSIGSNKSIETDQREDKISRRSERNTGGDQSNSDED